MTKFFVACLIFFLSYSGYSQANGIHFSDDLSWSEVLAKARIEHKYIFVDCYTTWCGPCRQMAEKIFPLPDVGTFFNNHFINVRVQIDRTPKDDDRVRSWYADASAIDSTYGVTAYPTYLIFAPDGHIVHRFVGMSIDGADFIDHARDAFDTDKQYYTMIAHYRDHAGDSAFLCKALTLAIRLYDTSNERLISDAYIAALNDPYSRSNLILLVQAINSTSGKAFALYVQNPGRIDRVIGKEVAEGLLINTIYHERIDPILASKAIVHWKPLSDSLHELYPAISNRIVMLAKVNYYRDIPGDRKQFEGALHDYVNTYSKQMTEHELNDMAWFAFQGSDDRRLLKEALQWSHQAIAHYPKVDWEFVDTYSNLLYKVGEREKAMYWERKAVDMAKIQRQKDEFEKNLRKMEEGTPTWE